MKFSKLLLITYLLVFSPFAYSQLSEEEELVRQLDDAERIAILKSDTAQLYILMSKKIVVHNPENTVVGFGDVMDRIREGRINYLTFERRVDKLTLANGIAVVMGKETLVPKDLSKNAGKTITRSFTNVWTKEDGVWKLTARQATIISIR